MRGSFEARHNLRFYSHRSRFRDRNVIHICECETVPKHRNAEKENISFTRCNAEATSSLPSPLHRHRLTKGHI